MDSPQPHGRFRKGEGGRPKGTKNKITIEVRGIAQGLLADRVYQKNLRVRLRKGTAGAIETLLWYYAWGKPAERVDVTWNLAALSDDELSFLERVLQKVRG